MIKDQIITIFPRYWYEDSVPLNIFLIFCGFIICIFSAKYIYDKMTLFKNSDFYSDYNNFLSAALGFTVGGYMLISGISWIIT